MSTDIPEMYLVNLEKGELDWKQIVWCPSASEIIAADVTVNSSVVENDVWKLLVKGGENGLLKKTCQFFQFHSLISIY